MRVLVLLFLFLPCLLPAQEIESLREMYSASQTDEQAAMDLFRLTEGITEDPAMVGYHAAALTTRASHAKKLAEKKDLFKQGAELLNATVNKNPDHIELRFVRLTIQEHAPKILGYRKYIAEDKQKLMEGYEDLQDNALKVCIREYVLGSELFSEEERGLIELR